MQMDVAQLRALGARLITPELVVFPVRHHSPGCAWQLRRLIAQTPPSAVLVEGPRSFTPMVPLLASPEARMPLAVYAYAVHKAEGERAEQRRSAYYPFCDYSPELVALREAHQRGIQARFIDLDFSEQSLLESAGDDGEGESLLEERHYRRSEHLQRLAQQLGCRDHEELWEHLFEVPAASLSLEEHVARVAAYCQLARVDSSEQELQADGTLQREAEMAWHVREALAQRPEGAGPVVAVVGGFHAVILPDLLASPPPRPRISRSAISDENAALIRYSFERLDRLNGYSAGMTSPAWHQRLWDQMLRLDKLGTAGTPQARAAAALDALTDVALELRGKPAVPLPTPALAAAYEQTLRLAQLRQRPAPVRDDVMDAVRSCFIKGDADADGALVLAATHRVLCGTAMGTVPPGAHTPPLVNDVAWRLRRQRLKVDDSQPRRAALDLYRRPAHRMTSRLLHGLLMLNVPFGFRTAGPDFVNGIGLDKLQEHWEYSYSAATEAALVEASVYGPTLPLAVANRFVERLDRMQADGEAKSASAAAKMLTQGCVLGLHDHLPRVIALLADAVAGDATFESVAAAVANLAVLLESREPLEARGLDELPALLTAGYRRAVYLGHELPDKPADPAATVQSLSQLRELLVSEAGRDLDAALYWLMLEHLQARHAAPLIRGAAAGLRYSAGRLPEADLLTALDGHFRGAPEPHQAVAFLRGLLQTAREIAWQEPRLLEVVDELLQHWDQDAFIAALPELRLAFAGMTPKETDRIAQAVGGLHGADDIGPLVHRALDAKTVQRNLELSQALRAVLVEDGLGEWVGA
ncbi:DUF5682 family protein [Lysobacter korlensis]|uniref:DUF5682 family protein n=1 Tax=Lysobacter korlensis TaxID=553636 RepID=A0ABV6S0N2_9GAMM